MSSTVPLARKELDDVLGGAETWKNADSTEGETRGQTVQRFKGPPAIACACALDLPTMGRGRREWVAG